MSAGGIVLGEICCSYRQIREGIEVGMLGVGAIV